MRISTSDGTFYSNLNYSRHRESQKIGYAINQGRGMMEYWSAGMLDLVEWDLILIRGIALRIRSDPLRFSPPTIPLFHHSTIPLGYTATDITPLGCRQSLVFWARILYSFCSKSGGRIKKVHRRRTINNQSSIFNIQFPDKAGFALSYNRFIRVGLGGWW